MKSTVFLEESPLPSRKRTEEEIANGSNSSAKKKKMASAVEETQRKERKVSREDRKSEKEEDKSQKGAAGAQSAEKKKSYFAYRSREGPRNLGSKELPQVNKGVRLLSHLLLKPSVRNFLL